MRHLGLATLLALLWIAPAPCRTQEQRDPVEEAPPAASNVLQAVPERFALQGHVLDQFERPAAGLTVAIPDSGNQATTDAEGRFALPAPVQATDRLLLTGEGYAPRRMRAAAVWAGHEGETGQSLLRVVRLTETFEVGPDGGRHDGEVGFEVPPGAVTETVVLRAARVPRALTWSEGRGIQPQPLTGVHLEPAGLELQRPIRVLLPRPPDLPEELDSAVVEILDPETGRYQPADEAAVEVEQERLVLTLSHFSGYRIGNPAQGVERRLLRRTWDVNGDDELSAEDADMVLVLRGGTHEAGWASATTVASTVLRTSGRSSETTEEETTSASAGVSFGGLGVEVSGEVSEETAREVLEKLGLSRTTERSETLRVGPVGVPEYERKCLYLLRIYNYWDVSLWRRLDLSAGAQDRFHLPDDEDWHYYGHEGDPIMISERLLPAGRYAARRVGGRREFYRQVDRFIVREPTGTTNYDCSTELPIAPRDLWRGGESLDEADFLPVSGGGLVSVQYGGWGVLPTTLPKVHRRIECGHPGVESEETVRAGSEETSETEITRRQSTRTSRGVSVSAEAPLPGGLGVSGSASWESAASQARSAASGYGVSLVRQEETTVAYGILSAHDHHESDHEVYKLHLAHTSRFWQTVDRSELPQALRGLGRASFGRAAGDGYVMRTADDRWFASGPPITTVKEIGLYVVRVAERFCGPERDRTMPVETPSGSGRGETETPSGGEDVETPGERAPGEQGARTVPGGSRVVLTGTVVAGEPASGTAVTPDGVRLTGVVVDVGGEEHTTDDEGRVTFTPPSDADTVVARFPDAEGTEPTRTQVVPRPEDLDPSAPPDVAESPRYVVPGDRVVLTGGPFDGEAGGTTVTAGEDELPVLASSPTEVVTGTDPSSSLGETEVVVRTETGDSAPVTITFLRLGLEASSRHLIRGQKATARLWVEGTKDELCIRVTNETPEIISFKQGQELWVETRGGNDNSVKLRFTGVSPGDFALGAEVVGEAGEGCGGD